MKQCPWWARWRHQRLREKDRDWLKLLFEKERGNTPGLWALFLKQRGQAHWNCRCAWRDERWRGSE